MSEIAFDLLTLKKSSILKKDTIFEGISQYSLRNFQILNLIRISLDLIVCDRTSLRVRTRIFTFR